MWLAYWGLSRDPFAERESPFVALPGHQETLSRLVHLAETGQRWGLLSGPPGLGKTRVLRRALSDLRGPSRRITIASDPVDGPALYGRLAEGLGAARPAGDHRSAMWRALEQAVRRCTFQKQQVVLAVDGVGALRDGPDRSDLHRLGSLGEAGGGRVTVLVVVRDGDATIDAFDRAWIPPIRMRPLVLSEAALYLEEKLAAAGCRSTLFSPRAVSRLHLRSGGIPRGLDHLASLCLMAGAARNHEAISSELVESLAAEGQSGTDLSFRDWELAS